MALKFDATLKDLVQDHPADWLAVLGIPAAGPVSVVTPDLSTVSAFTDLVLRVGDVLVHLDFQSGPDPDLPRRLLLYNALLHERYGLPVHTIVILLRPRANRSDLTGVVSYQPLPGRGRLDFTFEVVRLWEVPVEMLLQSGVGALPLAPLGRLPEGVTINAGLAAAVERMANRIQAEVPEPQAKVLLTSAYVLLGLRLSQEQALQLFEGVKAMRESTTYQAILDEGRVEQARKVLLRQGRKRFNGVEPGVEAALQGITDLERLERMSDQVLDPTVVTWQQLLATP